MAVTNFGGEEVVYRYDDSKIVIVPVPYDATSTYIRGADRGPEAVAPEKSFPSRVSAVLLPSVPWLSVIFLREFMEPISAWAN